MKVVVVSPTSGSRPSVVYPASPVQSRTGAQNTVGPAVVTVGWPVATPPFASLPVKKYSKVPPHGPRLAS